MNLMTSARLTILGLRSANPRIDHDTGLVHYDFGNHRAANAAAEASGGGTGLPNRRGVAIPPPT